MTSLSEIGAVCYADDTALLIRCGTWHKVFSKAEKNNAEPRACFGFLLDLVQLDYFFNHYYVIPQLSEELEPFKKTFTLL